MPLLLNRISLVDANHLGRWLIISLQSNKFPHTSYSCNKADNSYPRKLKQIVGYDLLVLDELGFKQLPKYSSDDFFAIISKRYEQKSTIITTNKEIEDWNDIFDEEVLTKAIVDRLMHHASILNIRGKSYRMKKFKKAEGK